MDITIKQQRFTAVFMHYIEVLLLHSRNSDGKSGDKLDGALDKASTTIHAVSAGVGLAATAVAGPTLGTSLGAAIVFIALLQTGNTCAKFVRRQVGNPVLPFIQDETKEADYHLTLHIFFREVAELAAIRYRFAIEHLKEEKVNEFAHYVFERVTLELNLQRILQQTPASVLDTLLSSVQLSTLYPSKTIVLNEETTPPAPFEAYLKWLCSRPRWIVYNQQAECKLYASQKETLYFDRKTTQLEYGYITLPESYLNDKSIAINTQNLNLINDPVLTIDPMIKENSNHSPQSAPAGRTVVMQPLQH